MQRRVRPGFDPTYVVEDHPTDPHETKYTVDAVGTEMLLYRDTASRRQRARDRVNTATSRALSALPRSWYAALIDLSLRLSGLGWRNVLCETAFVARGVEGGAGEADHVIVNIWLAPAIAARPANRRT